MIIVTIWADNMGECQFLSLIRNFVAKVHRSIFEQQNIKIGRLYSIYRTVVEIEFFLANPHDHAFGLYAGYEIKIRELGVSPRIIKEIAMAMEIKRGKRVADIDVYSLDEKTKRLAKYSRHQVEPKLIAKKYDPTQRR